MVQHRAIALMAALAFGSTFGSAYSAKPTYVPTEIKVANHGKLTHGQAFITPAVLAVGLTVGMLSVGVVTMGVIYTATRFNQATIVSSKAARLAKLDA